MYFVITGDAQVSWHTFDNYDFFLAVTKDVWNEKRIKEILEDCEDILSFAKYVGRPLERQIYHSEHANRIKIADFDNTITLDHTTDLHEIYKIHLTKN